MKRSVSLCVLFCLVTAPIAADESSRRNTTIPDTTIPDTTQTDTSPGDALLTKYFEQQVDQIEASTFASIETLADWEQQRDESRRQLAEMLGLDPLPERTPLKPVVTGTIEHQEFTVERLQFQSSPGLYVTGNLYLPQGVDGPAPTILYVCGHAQVKEGDVSFGNKTAYQHHGIWFAQHGYVCLMIDTLQLGEIEGTHHGTYRKKMWWWQSRGYTPAGIEAWNGIRALDYLETRPEVDAARIGVTGRSGGGASSWWIAALDDRIKVAVPVAGICNLRNHLLGPFQTSPWSLADTHGHDGCIEGHCDCMYFVNTYRWDFAMVAALVAPRPLLIANTDKDRIFPLDGVYDVYQQTQKIYSLYNATDKLGLQIVEGPHKDTQQLRVHAFQWMNRWLKNEQPLIDTPAEKKFDPATLQVFNELPTDQTNTTIHETFIPTAPVPSLPKTPAEWQQRRTQGLKQLRETTFGGWPDDEELPPLAVAKTFTTDHDGRRLNVYEFNSQSPYRLSFITVTNSARDLRPDESIVVRIQDESDWSQTIATLRGQFPDFRPDRSPDSPSDPPSIQESQSPDSEHSQGEFSVVYLLPRGVGPTRWVDNEKERTHIRRRFALIGQTLDGMRAWDVRRGLQALRTLTDRQQSHLSADASGRAAGWLIMAALFEPPMESITIRDIDPPEDLAVFLNQQRTLHWPVLLALVAEHTQTELHTARPEFWSFAQRVAAQLGWPPRQFTMNMQKSE